MGLFRKKCGYCRNKIEKDSSVKEKVKVLEFLGLCEKYFCCNSCLRNYKKTVEEKTENVKKCGGCCRQK